VKFPLPYAFARTQQVLLQEDAGELTLWLHPRSPRSAVAEVLRK
jgi:general secretion pathway protein E